MRFALVFVVVCVCVAYSEASLLNRVRDKLKGLMSNEKVKEALKLIKEAGYNAAKKVLLEKGIDLDKLLGKGKRMIEDEFDLQDAAAVEVTTNVGEVLQKKVSKALEKIEQAVEAGRQVAAGLKKKVKTLLAELGEQKSEAFEKLKGFWETLRNKISGEQAVDVDALFDSLEDEVTDELIGNVIATYGVKDFLAGILGNVKDTLGNVVQALSGHFNDFRDWIKGFVSSAIEKARPHIENVKQLAKEVLQYLEHAKQASAVVKEEALKFFGQYKNDLGALWKQVQESMGRITGGTEEDALEDDSMIGSGSGNMKFCGEGKWRDRASCLLWCRKYMSSPGRCEYHELASVWFCVCNKHTFYY